MNVMKAIIILLLVAGACVGCYFVYQNFSGGPADRVLVSGNIELEQVNIAFKTAGKIIERTVDEGDKVTKGQVVARLDKDQLMRQRDREVASLAELEAQLDSTRTALEMQKQSLVADREGREADLKTAEAKLQEVRNGSRPQEIEEAKQQVISAQSEYDRAKKDWERAEQLHKDDDIPTSQYDQAKNRLDSDEAQLKQAKEHLALAQEGSRKEDIEQAREQVEKAKAAVKSSQANELDIKRREEDIVGHLADIEREKAQIALIDSQIADTTAYSPIAGVVLVKSADVGEVVAPGTSVLTVGDMDHPWLRAYIMEQDLQRVKLGDKVIVTTDAIKGKAFDGRVSFISADAEFTPKQIQTTEERVKLVYRIKIDIANPKHELKSNMPADARILLTK